MLVCWQCTACTACTACMTHRHPVASCTACTFTHHAPSYALHALHAPPLLLPRHCFKATLHPRASWALLVTATSSAPCHHPCCLQCRLLRQRSIRALAPLATSLQPPRWSCVAPGYPSSPQRRLLRKLSVRVLAPLATVLQPPHWSRFTTCQSIPHHLRSVASFASAASWSVLPWSCGRLT